MASWQWFTVIFGEKNFAGAMVGISEHVVVVNPSKKYPPYISGPIFDLDMSIKNWRGAWGICFVNVLRDFKYRIGRKVAFRFLHNFAYKDIFPKLASPRKPPFYFSYEGWSPSIVVDHHAPWASEILSFVGRFWRLKYFGEESSDFSRPERGAENYISPFMNAGSFFLLPCHFDQHTSGNSQNNCKYGDDEGRGGRHSPFISVGEIKKPQNTGARSDDERAFDGLILLLLFAIPIGIGIYVVFFYLYSDTNINGKNKNKSDNK